MNPDERLFPNNKSYGTSPPSDDQRTLRDQARMIRNSVEAEIYLACDQPGEVTDGSLPENMIDPATAGILEQTSDELDPLEQNILQTIKQVHAGPPDQEASPQLPRPAVRASVHAVADGMRQAMHRLSITNKDYEDLPVKLREVLVTVTRELCNESSDLDPNLIIPAFPSGPTKAGS